MWVVLQRLMALLVQALQSDSKEKEKTMVCPNCGMLRPEDTIDCSCGWRKVIEYITLDEYFNVHRDSPEITAKIKHNAKELLKRVNSLLTDLKFELNDIVVTSGFRPLAYNIKVGGAKRSRHVRGLAIDIYDPTGNIYHKIVKNLGNLTSRDLSVEDGRYTPDWVHIQWPPPPSGRTIFIPYSGPPKTKKVKPGLDN